jgi:hypothetical protein
MKMDNKRALISGEVIMTIPRILFLIAILFAFVILVKMLIITEVDSRQVESNILINRILFSKDGIAYYDVSLGRSYPGIIDLKKFEEISKSNPNILDTEIISYGSDNPIITAEITLKAENKEDIVVYYNKDRFDKWEPRVLPAIEGGAGSFKAFKEQRYVLVKDGEIFSPAILDFYIII